MDYHGFFVILQTDGATLSKRDKKKEVYNCIREKTYENRYYTFGYPKNDNHGHKVMKKTWEAERSVEEYFV